MALAKYKVLKGRLSDTKDGVITFYNVGEMISLEKENAKFLEKDGDIEFLEDEIVTNKNSK